MKWHPMYACMLSEYSMYCTVETSHHIPSHPQMRSRLICGWVDKSLFLSSLHSIRSLDSTTKLLGYSTHGGRRSPSRLHRLQGQWLFPVRKHTMYVRKGYLSLMYSTNVSIYLTQETHPTGQWGQVILAWRLRVSSRLNELGFLVSSHVCQRSMQDANSVFTVILVVGR